MIIVGLQTYFNRKAKKLNGIEYIRRDDYDNAVAYVNSALIVHDCGIDVIIDGTKDVIETLEKMVKDNREYEKDIVVVCPREENYLNVLRDISVHSLIGDNSEKTLCSIDFIKMSEDYIKSVKTLLSTSLNTYKFSFTNIYGYADIISYLTNNATEYEEEKDKYDNFVKENEYLLKDKKEPDNTYDNKNNKKYSVETSNKYEPNYDKKDNNDDNHKKSDYDKLMDCYYGCMGLYDLLVWLLN